MYKYDKDKIKFPLVDLSINTINLSLETKIFLEYIGNIINCTLYFNNNELVGENTYVYCKINTSEYQTTIRSNQNIGEMILTHNNKNYTIKEKTDHNVQIIDIKKSDGLDKIYAICNLVDLE